MSTSLVAFNSPRQAFTPKQIAAFVFKPMLDEEGDLTGYHVCKACGKRRKHAPNNGYTILVTHVVEITIGKEMPVDFGLILDDCSFGTEQYQGVYGCYETPSGPQYPLLSISPAMDERGDHLTAEGHLMAIERFLPFFGKTIQGVKFLVGDNCAVNKRLAKHMKVPLVGCASHRLNLAVRDFLRPHESALEEVQQLMRKLRTLNQAAKL
ncbi:hypothetical protein JG688_00006711, partial [Phytophthora aleatoria]